MQGKKERKEIKTIVETSTKTDYDGSDLENVLSLRLEVPAAVDDVASWRGDVDGVQDRPQYLAEWSGDG